MSSWQDEIFVLHQCWEAPRSIQSNFAREWAAVIAALSSRGFITTETAPGLNDHGRIWKCSLTGLQHMGSMLDGATRETILEVISGEYQRSCEDDEWLEGENGAD